MNTRVILLSGIPASGKSTYARWLARERGFVHLDVEQRGALERAGLKLAWDSMFVPPGSVTLFTDVLCQQSHAVVIDWGFPPYCLSVVSALQRHGVEAWWFDGDKRAAQQSFIQRGTVPIQCFEIQMRAIKQEWSNIKTLFGPRMINTIGRGPVYMAPEDVSKLILGSTVI
jgi:hypothetical protein